MKIKPGVRIHGLRPEMIIALMVVRDVFGDDEVVITSGIEGKHSRGSLHYSGNALDFRTSHFAPSEAKEATKKIQQCLGGDFDVVLEHNHLHIEAQPKDPYRLS